MWPYRKGTRMALGSQKEKIKLAMPGGAPPGVTHDAKK
jgi:hypothetical protein